jgi:cytochrome bd ubiquinol oxidase subunit I
LDALTLARWQFGATTVYHFIFVPLSIGLVLLVALMQTLWYVRRRDEDLVMTRFFGKLFLINFAMGVATGLVQEFQFGMNWSSFSRLVGDVFGVPLAVEGLLAFFMESTFLGLWMFGWGRLARPVHLACIWLVALGTNLSALFILAANSWMQHPAGYRIDPATGRAVLTDIGAVLLNPTLLVTVPHTLFASLATGAMLVAGVSAYHLFRRNRVEVFRRAAAIGLVAGLVASLGLIVTGDAQGRMLTQTQPMKLAAAENLQHTQQAAPLSLIEVGPIDLSLPHGLSLLATHSSDGQVQGIADLQAEARARYGPGDYVPLVPVTYTSFRVMVGLGFVLAGLCALGLLGLRRGWLERSRWFPRAALLGVAAPFIANSAGWILRESGRQPWLAQGLFRTSTGVSPNVSPEMVVASLAGFVVLYGALAVIDVWLMARVATAGPQEERPEPEPAPVYAY